MKQLKGFQGEKQQLHDELVDCDTKIQSALRTTTSLQEKLEKATLQHRLKEDSMKCEMNELQK